MPTRKFSSEFLENLGKDDILSKEFWDKRRWFISWRLIFKHEDRFYSWIYSEGATECQEDEELEDEVECQEVFPVQKTVTVYERKPS